MNSVAGCVHKAKTCKLRGGMTIYASWGTDRWDGYFRTNGGFEGFVRQDLKKVSPLWKTQSNIHTMNPDLNTCTCVSGAGEGDNRCYARCCGIEPTAWMKRQNKRDRLVLRHRIHMKEENEKWSKHNATHAQKAAAVRARMRKEAAVRPLRCSTPNATLESANLLPAVYNPLSSYGVVNVKHRVMQQVVGGGFSTNEVKIKVATREKYDRVMHEREGKTAQEVKKTEDKERDQKSCLMPCVITLPDSGGTKYYCATGKECEFPLLEKLGRQVKSFNTNSKCALVRIYSDANRHSKFETSSATTSLVGTKNVTNHKLGAGFAHNVTIIKVKADNTTCATYVPREVDSSAKIADAVTKVDFVPNAHQQAMHYATTWHQTAKIECPKGEGMVGIRSAHDNHKEDRVFGYQCGKPDGPASFPEEQWSAVVNHGDHKVDYTCPNNGVLAGMLATYSGVHHDRNFQFLCRRQAGVVVTDVVTTSYMNGWDGKFKYLCPWGKVLVGMYSEHSNHHEDRRYKARCGTVRAKTVPTEVLEPAELAHMMTKTKLDLPQAFPRGDHWHCELHSGGVNNQMPLGALGHLACQARSCIIPAGNNGSCVTKSVTGTSRSLKQRIVATLPEGYTMTGGGLEQTVVTKEVLQGDNKPRGNNAWECSLTGEATSSSVYRATCHVRGCKAAYLRKEGSLKCTTAFSTGSGATMTTCPAGYAVTSCGIANLRHAVSKRHPNFKMTQLYVNSYNLARAPGSCGEPETAWGETSDATMKYATNATASGYMQHFDVNKGLKASSWRHSASFFRGGGAFGEEQSLELHKNHLLTTLTTHKNYKLQFIIMPLAKISGWSNVLHFTATNKNGGVGGRIPAIFFFSGTTRMHVKQGRPGHPNDGCDTINELPLMKWSTVTLQLLESTFTVHVNGELWCSRSSFGNSDHGRSNVKVYASDKFHKAAKARIMDFEYGQARPDETPTTTLLNFQQTSPPPMEKGFCVTSTGTDQNTGVVKVNAIDANTVTAQSECLQACQAKKGATGCEVT